MTPTTNRGLLENNKISLRDYVEALMHEYRNAHNREHVLMSEAEDRSRQALEIRLEQMNEFRAQILSERGSMITKDKFDALHELLERRVNQNEQTLANLKGRMVAIGAALGVGLLVMELILRFVVR